MTKIFAKVRGTHTKTKKKIKKKNKESEKARESERHIEMERDSSAVFKLKLCQEIKVAWIQPRAESKASHAIKEIATWQGGKWSGGCGGLFPLTRINVIPVGCVNETQPCHRPPENRALNRSIVSYSYSA